jgi:hypothetical protein
VAELKKAIQSFRPSGYTPAFGRAEARFHAQFTARLKSGPSGLSLLPDWSRSLPVGCYCVIEVGLCRVMVEQKIDSFEISTRTGNCKSDDWAIWWLMLLRNDAAWRLMGGCSWLAFCTDRCLGTLAVDCVWLCCWAFLDAEGMSRM